MRPCIYTCQKYIAPALISARSNFAYLAEIIGRQLFLAVVLYILLCLWKMTYAHSGVKVMAGLTLSQMLWYITATEAIILSGSPISSIIDEEVRTGSLALQLVRPVSYPLYKLSLYLGERAVKLLANFAIGALLCFLLVKELPITPSGVLALLLALPLAITLDFLGNFLVGLGAFWLESTSGIWFIYTKLAMILGGMLLPLDLLPAPFNNIAKASPFAGMLYAPARQFVHPCKTELFQCLILQLVWIIILSCVVYQVYRTAINRVGANGG